jgi:ABC-type arginine/histidine transport system permease subunit
MKTMIKRIWAGVKPIAIPAIAYAALPLCLAALAGLIGFGFVVALDVWGDIYFVDGVPIAAAFVIVSSLCGLGFLKSVNAPSNLWTQFTAPYKQAKTAWASLNTVQFTQAVSGALDMVRRFGWQSSKYGISNAELNSIRNIHPRNRNKAIPLIHSVVWGKSIDRHYDLNRSTNLEMNQNYAAQK